MTLSGDNADNSNSDEKRAQERYKTGIPVLIQKRDLKSTCECTLIDISLNGFAIRLENGKFKLNLEDNFLLVFDPKLFDLEDISKIQINSVCKRIDFESLIIGGTFYKNTESNEKIIQFIVNTFKKINENDY